MSKCLMVFIFIFVSIIYGYVKSNNLVKQSLKRDLTIKEIESLSGRDGEHERVLKNYELRKEKESLKNN